MDANSWASRPIDRNSRSSELRSSTSSSMIKTVGFASGIAATHDQRIMETSLCLGRKFGVTVHFVNLIPICGHEQPRSPPQDTRGIDQGLRVQTWLDGT